MSWFTDGIEKPSCWTCKSGSKKNKPNWDGRTKITLFLINILMSTLHCKTEEIGKKLLRGINSIYVRKRMSMNTLRRPKLISSSNQSLNMFENSTAYG